MRRQDESCEAERGSLASRVSPWAEEPGTEDTRHLVALEGRRHPLGSLRERGIISPCESACSALNREDASSAKAGRERRRGGGSAGGRGGGQVGWDKAQSGRCPAGQPSVADLMLSHSKAVDFCLAICLILFPTSPLCHMPRTYVVHIFSLQSKGRYN